MIQIEDLDVRKADRTICRVPELRCDIGDRVAILGSNGSGKTTLLRVLAGIEKQFEGQCRVAASVKERVFVHQSPYLFRGSVMSNLVYGLKARGIGPTEAECKASPWLERMGIASIAFESARHLSGGETRRVALARAMVLEPKLLLLDEPLAEMDDQGEQAVREALDSLPTDVTVLITCPTGLPAGLVVGEYRMQTR